LLVFVAVVREGIETVIFLGAASLASPDNNAIGALAGIVVAILLGYAMFAGSRKVNLKTFFNVTSILLILFAAGLVGRGIHELQEAHVVPEVIEHVWNLNPPVNPDGSYPVLHENGLIGGLLRSLFGYSASPSLVEVIGYLGYLTVVWLVWRRSTA
jgi:high-affinity iron transporter